MRLSMPGFGDSLKTNKGLNLKAFLKLTVRLLILALLVFGGYLTYKHFHKSAQSQLSTQGYTTPDQFEKSSQSAGDQYLKSKDYTSYISKQISLAGDYTAQNDYKNAERVMNEMFANVPSNKVTSLAYNEMAFIEQGLGNQAGYKKYLGLLLGKYKSEGNTSGVQATQQVLDSLK